MKISEMIENLEAVKKEYGDIDCWYAKDSEGNGYEEICFEPSVSFIGSHTEIYHDIEDVEYCGTNYKDVTPICIVN